MPPVVNAIIGISLTFICTALGSALVFFFRNKKISQTINQIFIGFASGIMLAASIFSLIVPATKEPIEYMPSWLVVAISIVVGALFIWGIDKLVPHIHQENNEEGIKTTRLSRNAKMFLSVTIHNIPEGLSVGIAYGVALATWSHEDPTLLMGALMLAIGMGIQNVPEGAAVALTMQSAGNSAKKSFLFGSLSGAVEPVAAVIGLFFAMQVQVIMPWALAFAAGCMLYVIIEEMVPDMKGDSIHHFGVWSFVAGFVLMMVLDIALG